ncbi:MAG: tRNA (5-methylaminomethyl-2-thiouridylate)-methyltransferase [Gammaproteobacteria bacterium]|nr:tRNA (5-methylaminomethyl-2-thiouridylate)-methyltransferase [Gammaproteobacteria bacterium]MCF6231407.1 tRNA (5-methylaminomethyl-2-thiouridylate)-methyltransferase [Gammaproteobacteria bacterium]
MTKQRKAVALISGGLDSLLAAKVMLEQGIHVEGINFYTGFCVEGHTHAIRKKDKAKPKRNNALWSAEQLGIKLHIIDVIDEYKEVLINPKHGYGANMNPCLDCKCFMVSKAREWAKENNFDFIITGEVVGQRPMSQRRDTMNIVSRESGAADILVRPLCAKNLPETLPEREGWISRDGMYDFNGRSRKPQIALASQFGFKDYAQPAGGCCFLTDESYSKKLVDLWDARNSREYEMDDIMLLKVGRHIRPKPHFKLIIGREDGENRFMDGYRKQFDHFTTVSCPGPLVLIDGEMQADDIELAARLVARFSKDKNSDAVTVCLQLRDGTERPLTVTPLRDEEIPEAWYI